MWRPSSVIYHLCDQGTSYITSLSPRFVICKMGIISVLLTYQSLNSVVGQVKLRRHYIISPNLNNSLKCLNLELICL